MRLWCHLLYIFWSTNHSHWHNDIFKGFVGQCWFFMYGSQASLERRKLELSSRYVPSSRYVRWTTVVPDLCIDYVGPNGCIRMCVCVCMFVQVVLKQWLISGYTWMGSWLAPSQRIRLQKALDLSRGLEVHTFFFFSVTQQKLVS